MRYKSLTSVMPPKKSPNKEKISFRAHMDVIAKAKNLAIKLGRDLSEIYREALAIGIEQMQKDKLNPSETDAGTDSDTK